MYIYIFLSRILTNNVHKYEEAIRGKGWKLETLLVKESYWCMLKATGRSHAPSKGRTLEPQIISVWAASTKHEAAALISNQPPFYPPVPLPPPANHVPPSPS